MKIIQSFDISDKLLTEIQELSRNMEYKEVGIHVQEGVLYSDVEEQFKIDLPEVFTTISECLYSYLSKFKPIPYKLALESMEILRYPSGTKCVAHCDQELVTDNPDFSLLLLTSVLFLNDDFDGGELCFPDHNFVVEPKAGKLVIFPCSFMVPHAVNLVDGERNVLITNFAVPSKS